MRIKLIKKLVCLCLGLPLIASAQSTATVTILEGEAALLRGTTRYALLEGVRLAPADIVQTAPGWDSAVLKQVEAQLARFIGPVAKVMVKRVAAGTNDIATLYARLADNLSSREEKKAFLTGGAELQVTLPSPSESQSATPRSGVDQRQLAAAPVTPETVAQATRLLAAYLGPIARIVIKKAAAQATDRRQFYQILADSVSNEGDRIRFLQDVRAVS